MASQDEARRYFFRAEDPHNLWHPPVPEGWSEEATVDAVIEEIAESRRRLEAHYLDWYSREEIPLDFSHPDNEMLLTQNYSRGAIEIHVAVRYADQEGVKRFGTWILKGVEFQRVRHREGGGTGYRSHAKPKEPSDTETGEVAPASFSRTFAVPDGARQLVITTTDPDPEIRWLVEGETEPKSYGELNGMVDGP